MSARAERAWLPIFIPAIGAFLVIFPDLAGIGIDLDIGISVDFFLAAGFALVADLEAAFFFAVFERVGLVGFFLARVPIFMPMGICIFAVSAGACC